VSSCCDGLRTNSTIVSSSLSITVLTYSDWSQVMGPSRFHCAADLSAEALEL
jgi:hypothetical protein